MNSLVQFKLKIQTLLYVQLRIKSEWGGYQPIDQEEIQPQQGEEWQ